MIELFPAVHCLLVLLLALLEEDVDDAGVGNIAVLLEVLADAVTNVRRRYVECVDRDNFRGLELPCATTLDRKYELESGEAERTPRYQSR